MKKSLVINTRKTCQGLLLTDCNYPGNHHNKSQSSAFQCCRFQPEGRWDITMNMDGKEVPSWLEVRHSGTHRLIGHFVGGGGSARPISSIKFNNGKMTFTIPPQWEKEENDISFEATLQDQ
jgi:hypothetical protein